MGLSWGWVGVMLACSLIGGLAIQALIESTVSEEALSTRLTLVNLLEQSRPAGTLADQSGRWLAWTWPNEHDSHAPAIAIPVTLLATGTWLGGIGLATIMYWLGWLHAEDVRRQFAPVYRALVNKWYFDELYAAIFVKPTMVLSRMVALFDRGWIDWIIDNLGRGTVWVARRFELIADRGIVDGFVNVFAGWTYSLGLSLRTVQTGRLRQYVLFIVVGAVALFILISFVWTPSFAR
jgi:NADH:ubiquinone oxidoreductase subunit 5 (subunit L)/multisubunit Na+/H+ antiporter MnhA subunit